MKIFISWSGERAGAAARALADWLPDVLPGADPWYSPDVPKGAEFFSELSTAIEEAEAGIVCVTPENQTRPWLLFEAGALAKKFGTRPRVCTYLVGLKKVELVEPLNRYQATEATSEDTWRLVRTLNAAESTPRAEDRVLRAFNSFWPRLEEELSRIPQQPPQVPAASNRSERDLLEEILLLLRDQRAAGTRQARIVSLWDPEEMARWAATTASDIETDTEDVVPLQVPQHETRRMAVLIASLASKVALLEKRAEVEKPAGLQRDVQQLQEKLEELMAGQAMSYVAGRVYARATQTRARLAKLAERCRSPDDKGA